MTAPTFGFTVYPAIDVREGRVVRLRQGDYAQETRYPDAPLEVAARYARAGARWLHLVDLDAAREGGYTLAPSPGVRVPHMGWNRLRQGADDPLLAGVADGAQAYFVHGYAAPVGGWTVATSTHGTPFSAVVRSGRCWGAQFHPERSGEVGAQLLRNFLEIPA